MQGGQVPFSGRVSAKFDLEKIGDRRDSKIPLNNFASFLVMPDAHRASLYSVPSVKALHVYKPLAAFRQSGFHDVWEIEAFG